jgi:rhodanese-related sulfurtransferase
MKKIEIFYVSLLVIGAFWALAVGNAKKDVQDHMTPCQLLDIAATADKYISTDELARKMMSNDPTIVLIDLRSPADFEKFSLRGAINIPLDSALNPENEDILNQKIFTNVFYSNSSDMAAKLWIITKRLGYNNNYILQGGLNRWVETILRPKRPSETAVNTEFELYNFRRAASSYFGGGSVSVASTLGDKPNAVPIKRKKKEAAGGGCD